MFSLARVLIVALVAAGIAVETTPQQREPEPDVFAKRGVFVETDLGIVELRVFAESRALNDAMFDGSLVKAYRYRIEPTKPVPRATAIASFIVNEPGGRADAWMVTSQLIFVVGRDVEQGSNVYFPMTTKVTKLRASVYHIISPELNGTWLRQMYEKGSAKAGASSPPEAFIGLLMQEWSGQPRKLYPVQVFP